MKSWKAVLTLVVFASTVLFGAAAWADGLKVAVIDVNKILNESEAGKAAKKKMEARYEELKKKVDAKQEEARKMKDDLDKQKVLLGKEKQKEKEEALATKVRELQQLTQESEKEMRTRQQELTDEVLKSIESQVKKVVDAEKIDLLLEKSAGVVHASAALDVTDKVLGLVNTELKGAAGGK